MSGVISTAERLRREASDILRGNTIEAGGLRYTVPTHGLYPHQWNWDSAICAMGFATIDAARAWDELEALIGAQDSDGLIAHIAFNADAVSYQPGPEWWSGHRGDDGRQISGITQPPVAAMALLRLLDRTGDIDRARRLVEPLQRWHDWFLSVRDPEGRGEPVVVHPWESGRDNAVEWDVALNLSPEAEVHFVRADTEFVSAEQRPTKVHYQHFMGLLEQFGDLGWDQTLMARGSAFRMLDPGFSAILSGACADLAQVAARCGENAVADRAANQSRRIAAAIDARRDSDGRAWAYDLSQGVDVKRWSVALGFQLSQPDLDPRVVETLASDCLTGALASPWGVCSTSPDDPDFEPLNYWRGPVWTHITWLVGQGLRRQGGHDTEVAELHARMLRAVTEGGFNEYLNPLNGRGLGGQSFSWTAAVTLDALAAAE